MVVTTMLVATSLIAPPLAPAQAEEPEAPDGPGDLIPESEPPPASDPSEPAGTFTAPEATGFDLEESELIERRTTATREVYENPDGTFTAVVSPSPVRYRDENGDWQDIDLTLDEAADGSLEPTASALDLTIPEDPADGLVQIESAAGPVTMSVPDVIEQAEAPVAEDLTAEVAGSDGLSTTVDLTTTGFKQSVIVPDASGPSSYDLTFEVPAGVTARQGELGVEFVDAAGRIVGLFGGGVAFDSAVTPSGTGAEMDVTTTLAGQAGTAVTVAVSVDREWFTAPSRVFPVTIDPSWTGNTNSLGADTWVKSDIATSKWSDSEIRVGTFDGGATVARGFLRFALPGLFPSPDVVVLDADLHMRQIYAPSCTPSPIRVAGLAANFNSSTVWSNAPAPDTFGIVSATNTAKGFSGACPTGWVDLDATAAAQRWFDGSQSNFGIRLRAGDETDSNSWKRFNSGDSGATNAPQLIVTYNRRPPGPQQIAPTDGATVLTTRPTFEVITNGDPDGDPVSVWYRIWSQASSVERGQVIDSGWVSGTTWTPPAGSLVDGVTYRWRAYTGDGISTPALQPLCASSCGAYTYFTIDTRSGASDLSPADQAGPVSVNLATGGATVSVSSPTYATVGGDIGLSYTYDSQVEPLRGLTGRYYDDNDEDHQLDDSSDDLVASRIDTTVGFRWYQQPPAPGMDEDHYVIRWDGWVTVPTTGSYDFGLVHDQGAKVTVDGVTVVNRWTSGASTTPAYGSAISLTAGQRVPIRIDLWTDKDDPAIMLYARGAVPQTQVPSDWLSPSDSPDLALPAGWHLSFDALGGLRYTSAQVTNDAVLLTYVDGSVDEFRRVDGAWVAPPGSNAVLSVDAEGVLTLVGDDGVTYVFNPDGGLASVTSAVDDENTAAPSFTWEPLTVGGQTRSRLTTITDPVSGREMALTYGDGTNCAGPGGFDAHAPVGMLCHVDYWDGRATELLYQSGQLAIIEDPGASKSGFVYTDGRLSAVIDPHGADVIQALVLPIEDGATLISYDSSSPPRVSAVDLPDPDNGHGRPGRTYSYSPAHTDVHVAGLTEPSGYARRVSFDSLGRPVSERDLAGLETTSTWDDADRLVGLTDPTGLRTTTIYDDRGFATDSYGPAPATSFASDGTPLYGHTVPREQTRYDEGMNGLAATWWDNADLSGDPVEHSLGIGGTGGAIDKDWGAGAPSGLPSDNFSGRLTGAIVASASTQYHFTRNGKVRMWIDGELVIDLWTEATGTTAETAFIPAGSHDIVIEYADTSGNAQLRLREEGFGIPQATVPGTKLRPLYGLPTSTVDAAGRTRSLTYADAELGIVTSTTVDPGGLALTSSTTTETPGTGHYRRTVSRTAPGGDVQTDTYYGADGAPSTADDPCTSGTQVIHQGGGLRTSTFPTPASGPAKVETWVYDQQGLVLAHRVNSEDWTCMTYDDRGRMSTTTFPSYGGAPARTVTYDYDAGGDPRVATITDAAGTISSTVDILGRQIATTDVWGIETTREYSEAGQLIAESGPAGVMEPSYTVGRLTSVDRDGELIATLAYDSVGRPNGISYPGGSGQAGNGTSLAAPSYDSLQRATGPVWKTPGGSTFSSSIVTLSTGGQVIDESIDGTDAYTSGPNFGYDGAGRLTSARVPGHTFTYGFAPTGGCGALTTAGRNGNRTSVVDNGSTTTYCYDGDNRLTSTSASGMGTIAYDSHGNNTQLGGETRSYDGADRLVTTTSGSTTVSYLRDASGRVVERTETGQGTTRYTYGFDSTPAAVVDGSDNVLEASVPLPGGVLLTDRSSGEVWSYPNARGDLVASRDGAGAAIGSNVSYDPDGRASGALLDNGVGAFDLGWQANAGYVTEHGAGLRATPINAASSYLPDIGRSLQARESTGCAARDRESILPGVDRCWRNFIRAIRNNCMAGFLSCLSRAHSDSARETCAGGPDYPQEFGGFIGCLKGASQGYAGCLIRAGFRSQYAFEVYAIRQRRVANGNIFARQSAIFRQGWEITIFFDVTQRKLPWSIWHGGRQTIIGVTPTG